MAFSKRMFQWVDQRFPLNAIWNNYFVRYLAPKNLNFWYFFGSLSLLVFVMLIVSGIWLAMDYTPVPNAAFDSVQHIMRNVQFGWLIRYIHTTSASAFFIVIYLHIYRAIIYGSYQKPRELLWTIGMVIYLLLIAQSFFGYILPWGQMSYWAAEVISSVIKAIPLIGDYLYLWLLGDYTVSSVTLHRYFALHVTALPIILTLLVILHLIALRTVGSNNPTGKNNVERVPFHPYYTSKDIFAAGIFLLLFSIVLFYFPDMYGYFLEPENLLPANQLVTPEHIRPAWYLSPYYAILRGIPNKAFGIFAMMSAILILFFLPWLDRSKARALYYKGNYSKVAVIILVISFIGLGVLGMQQITPLTTWLTRIFAILYFAFFLLMPFYTYWENKKISMEQA